MKQNLLLQPTLLKEKSAFAQKPIGDFTGKIQTVKLYVDNQGALKLIHHPHSHQRTKHIDIAYRFIQDRVERGEISCEYIETSKMVPDCMTRAVPLAKLNENIRDMG